MRYILASQAKSQAYGIKISSHVTKGSKVVLNEKELMYAPALGSEATLEGKAALIEGIIYQSSAELLNKIND